jgi:hypothetical protein
METSDNHPDKDFALMATSFWGVIKFENFQKSVKKYSSFKLKKLAAILHQFGYFKNYFFIFIFILFLKKEGVNDKESATSHMHLPT